MPPNRSIIDAARAVVAVGTLWLGFLTLQPPAQANDWVEMAQMNRPRGEHANAVVGGKIYVMGGIFSSTDGPDEIELFDPATNTWTDIGTMPLVPENRSRHHITIGSTVYQNGNGDAEIWIVGGKPGNDATGVDFVDVFNVTTGEWRIGPDLPQEMWGGPSVIVGDTLHAFAGAQARLDTENFHYSLDLSNANAQWQNEVKVPRPRVHASGVTVDDKIYLIGGELTHSHDTDTRTVQIYDTSTQSWSFGANLPMARSHSEWATFTHEGEIWSVSGVDSSNAPNRGQSEIFIYNPSDDLWREFEIELPVDLVSPGAKIIDDTLYVFGGGENDWFEGEMRNTYALTLPQTIDGDLDGDGVVAGDDFLEWQQDVPNNPNSGAELAAWLADYSSLNSNGPLGDFDGDQTVTGQDFLHWQRTALTSATANAELLTWQGSYANSSSTLATASSIPEPTTLATLGWAVFILSVASRFGR